jgi:hypothetical protein
MTNPSYAAPLHLGSNRFHPLPPLHTLKPPSVDHFLFFPPKLTYTAQQLTGTAIFPEVTSGFPSEAIESEVFFVIFATLTPSPIASFQTREGEA